jgi:4-carboxymuconolactone decarboxylase
MNSPRPKDGQPYSAGAVGQGRCYVDEDRVHTSWEEGFMADKPVLDLLARMTADSLEVSSLDPESIMLVRIAALISVDAPPASYLLNLGMASETDIDAEQVRAVLAAVAPIVGTARVASAAGNIARALGLALDLAELEEEAEADA